MTQLMRNSAQFFELLEKYKDCLVIVEGKKDKAALELFGFSNVRFLNKALYKVVEEITSKESVLLLTDLDKKGKELYGKLHSDLTSRGVFVDNTLRNFLWRNSKIKQIEGLKNILERE